MTHWGWYWKIKKTYTKKSVLKSRFNRFIQNAQNNKLFNGYIVKPLDIYAERVAEGLKISYRKRNTSAILFLLTSFHVTMENFDIISVAPYAGRVCEFSISLKIEPFSAASS